MIKFRQKEFWIGPALMAATSILGLKQGADAQKEQEEANEAAAREQRRHNRAMEKAAMTNPEALQKDFAAPGSILKTAGGFAKDLIGTQKGNMKSALGTATTLAGTAYLGNRLATSVKDHKENNDQGNKNFLKKAAIGAGVIGGSILAAKKGGLGKPIQNFMTTGKGGQTLSTIGKAVNPIVKNEAGKISVKGTLGKNAINAGFIAAPTISYLAKKKSENDMAENTQKEFAAVPMSVMRGLVKGRQAMGAVKNGVNTFKSHPGLSISGGLNRAASFMGFYGKGGTKAVQNTVSKLAEAGQKSGNTWTQGTAKFLGEHKKTANLLATGGTLAAGTGMMKLGTAAVEKPARLLDNDAYKMEDQENDKI